MPSRRHQLVAWVIPRTRKSGEPGSPESERDRLALLHASQESVLPTNAVRGFDKRFSLVTEVVQGSAGTFSSYVVTPRHSDPRRTVVYLHGGAYVAGIDPFHVRYI